MHSRSSPAERLFALLLLAYPKPFRDAFAGELMAFFREDRGRTGDRGLAGGLRFWRRTLADLLRSAARQRLGAPAAEPPPPRRKAGLMNNLQMDVRFAARSLLRSPGFTAVALATLVLGIGATTGILSVIDGVMLRGLPYPEADRLVVIGGVFDNDPDDIGPLSAGNLQDLRFRVPAIEAFVAADDSSKTLLGGGDPELIETAEVTEGFFELLGVPLALGRGFTADDHLPGAPRVAVLEHGFWRSRWGGDPGVLDDTITLDGETFSIVGVATADFHPPEAIYSLRDARMWIPWRFDWRGQADRDGFGYAAIGRLAAGIAQDAANEQIDAVFRQASRDHSPEFEVGGGVVPLRERTLGAVGEPLRLLLLGSGFLLLIACANVANLMLARGTARGREVAVRAALGAGRGRIARQLLTESLLLALVAGLLAVPVAYGSIELLKALSPGGIPRLAEVTVDVRVLALALLLSAATGALFGLAPVAQSQRGDLVGELREGAGSASPSAARGRARGALVVAEVALALVLLVSAGLLVNSFVQLTRVDAGFEAGGLTSMRLNLRGAYPEREQWAPFFLRLLERVEAHPAVESASLSSSLPFAGITMISSMVPEDGATEEEAFIPTTYVSRGHFRTMGMTLRAGREFGPEDRAGGPAVVIVNETLAEQFWPGADTVIGRRLKLGSLDDEDLPWIEVVGLVNALRYRFDRPLAAEIYLPIEQDSWRSTEVVARASAPSADLAPILREAVWSLDADLPVDRVRPVVDLARSSVVGPRFYSLLAAAFALLALALALVGVYGTMAYSVGQRSREIGIRIALGADHGRVLGLVVGSGFRLAGVGIVFGLLGAWAMTRLLDSFLFGVTPTDLPTFAIAAGLFAVTAAIACYVPARRAARLDPIRVLRADG